MWGHSLFTRSIGDLQTVQETPKRTINQDSYLYAVHQAQDARLKADGSFQSHLRYEPFLLKTWTRPEPFNLSSFKKNILEVVDHHFHTLPNYRRKESLTADNLAWFALSIATLLADLDTLVLAYTGMPLPKFNTPSLPKQNNSKNVALAIQKWAETQKPSADASEGSPAKFSLFPLLDENNVDVSDLFTQELWSLVTSFIKKVFGSHADLFVSYVEWKYSDVKEQDAPIDWSVRPPCGSAYRRQFKELFDDRRNRFDKSDKGNKNSGKRPEAPAAKKESTDEKSAPKKFQEHKRPRHEDAPRPNGARLNGNGRHPHSNDDGAQNQQALDAALKEAHLAIEKIQNDRTLPEFSLKPQNSFIRRQQHVLIAEAGFETESRGEGPERCVCIIQKELLL